MLEYDFVNQIETDFKKYEWQTFREVIPDECKNWNKENVILKMSTWNHLINQIPINSNKIPIFVFQNNKDKKFVTLELDDFFRLLKEK